MAKRTWKIDPAHSEIQFKVKHMLISTVTGQFNEFDCTVETEDDDFHTARIVFTADIQSISTNNEQRDKHLLTGDFFLAEEHPQVRFESDGMEKVGEGEFRLKGNLTMRGVTKPVTLDVNYGGMMKDNYGNTRAGFEVRGKVNRREYGISFSMISETGGILLSDEVKLVINAQFIRQEVGEPELAEA